LRFIIQRRANDHSNQGFSNWPFLTVQLWGEKPHGQWKLQVVNTGGGTGNFLLSIFSPDCFFLLAVLMSWRLVVHGTRDYPISPRSSPATSPSSVSFNPFSFLFSSSTSIFSHHLIFIFFNSFYLYLI
jgi:hypothetical protein